MRRIFHQRRNKTRQEKGVKSKRKVKNHNFETPKRRINKKKKLDTFIFKKFSLSEKLRMKEEGGGGGRHRKHIRHQSIAFFCEQGHGVPYCTVLSPYF